MTPRQERNLEWLRILPNRASDEPYVMTEFSVEESRAGVWVSRKWEPPRGGVTYSELWLLGPRGAKKRVHSAII